MPATETAAGVEPVWRRLLARARDIAARPAARDAARLGLASALACTAAMLVAKVICILSITSTDLGTRQLGHELSFTAPFAWFGPDLWAGTLWGLLIGATLGFARNPRARFIATIIMVVLHLVLAVALLFAVGVYELFGTPPTWQLLGSLSDPNNATDSVADLLTPGRIAIVSLLAVVLAGGTPLLRRLITARPGWARRLALGQGTALALFTVIGLMASTGRFELDRNLVLTFFKTALFGQSLEAASDAPYREVVAPVAPAEEPRVDMAPYAKLRSWAKRKPNVVLVILETTSVRHLGVTGGPVNNTPTLSRLKNNGLFWPRHYAHTPSSMFAIYQILSSNHGRPQKGPITVTRPRIAARALPEVFTDNGYRAGLFHSGRFSYSRKDLFLAGRGYEVLYDTLTMPNREHYKESSWGIEEAASIDAMLTWASKDQSKPFFITWIPVYPHHPYTVPDPKYHRFHRRGSTGHYENSMFYVDSMIGDMMQGLRDRGLEENTLFVFTGDHGEGFGEHPGSRMHGSKIFDEAIRTFALWYAPGVFARGFADPRTFGHIDIAPTLLDIMGFPQQQQHMGLSAGTTAKRPMVAIYTGYGNPFVGFVDGRYKFIHNRRNGKSELYDLQTDPDEKKSIQADHRDWVRTYRKRAKQFVGAQRAWEDSLPDLTLGGTDLNGPIKKWTVNPASCSYPSKYFHDKDGVLNMSRGAEKTVTCEYELPETPGAVQGMTMKGNESLNSAFITGMVVWRQGSARRQVAYCTLNGNNRKIKHECTAKLVQGSTGLGGGGRLVLEIRYVTTERIPPFGRFGIREVEVTYQLRE